MANAFQYVIGQEKLRQKLFNSKIVKKLFAFTETNQLDHKEQVCTQKHLQLNFPKVTFYMLFLLDIKNNLCEFNTKVIHARLFDMQVMFPVLQNISTVPKVFCGHYYLINLNLKAERFEIMDSMRKESDKMLKTDSSKIIASIKTLWAIHYRNSNIKIHDWECAFIPTPKQLTR